MKKKKKKKKKGQAGYSFHSIDFYQVLMSHGISLLQGRKIFWLIISPSIVRYTQEQGWGQIH